MILSKSGGGKRIEPLYVPRRTGILLESALRPLAAAAMVKITEQPEQGNCSNTTLSAIVGPAKKTHTPRVLQVVYPTQIGGPKCLNLMTSHASDNSHSPLLPALARERRQAAGRSALVGLLALHHTEPVAVALPEAARNSLVEGAVARAGQTEPIGRSTPCYLKAVPPAA